MGDPEATANLYCNITHTYWGRLRDLQHIFAAIYGTPSRYEGIEVGGMRAVREHESRNHKT